MARRLVAVAIATAGVLICAESRADFEFNAGAGLGSIQVGVGRGQFVVSPNFSGLWRGENWFFSLSDTLMLVGLGSHVNTGSALITGFGFDNQASVAVGYAFNDTPVGPVRASFGGSFAQYWMITCSDTTCGRVLGLAPGGHARVDIYPWVHGGLGLSFNADAGYYGGHSKALPGGLAVMFTGGPIVRITRKYQ